MILNVHILFFSELTYDNSETDVRRHTFTQLVPGTKYTITLKTVLTPDNSEMIESDLVSVDYTISEF